MEETIKCPECGDEEVPDFGMCPTCNYEYTRVDYTSQGAAEENFDNLSETNISRNNLFGKVKVLGFVIVFILIIIIFLNK